MTPTLDEMRSLERQATAGPWYTRSSASHPAWFGEGRFAWQILAVASAEYDPDLLGFAVLFGESYPGDIVPTSADLDFIAAARTFIPQAIAEIERLQSTLAAYQRDLIAATAEANGERLAGEQLRERP